MTVISTTIAYEEDGHHYIVNAWINKNGLFKLELGKSVLKLPNDVITQMVAPIRDIFGVTE
jgi:hypothetical protein